MTNDKFFHVYGRQQSAERHRRTGRRTSNARLKRQGNADQEEDFPWGTISKRILVTGPLNEGQETWAVSWRRMHIRQTIGPGSPSF